LKTSASSKRIRLFSGAWDLLRLVPVLCIGVLLLNTFRLYKGGAYFWLDDFNNLYWVQRTNFAQMVRQVVNPDPAYFRPVGMICYWALMRLFGLNSAPYHWLAWLLHTANTVLAYFLLRHFTKSHAGAAVGAMLFASQAVFADLYWDFGTIFELVAVFFSFVGTLVWTSERRGWWQVLLASLALLLAMKAKEMAITMPFVWFSYDLLLRKNMERRLAAHWALPGSLALWYGITKALWLKGLVPSHPYYTIINGWTLAAGFGTYFNMLFKTNFPWQTWCIGMLLLLLLFVSSRSRVGIFFQLYIFVTFLPVIFLLNHRFAFFWYLPFLGVCGLAAVLANTVVGLIPTQTRQWVAKTGALAVFALLCWGTFLLHEAANRPQRSWVKDRASEYRAFITGLAALPPPPRDETIFFDSRPSLFDEGLLLSATQVAFRRTDLHAKLVSEFPSEARYRLRFQESRLIELPR